MRTILTLIAMSICTMVSAQTEMASWYDFWVGKWEVTWKEKENAVGKGVNNVVKILDGKVIQENFAIHEGSGKGYLGTSLSVFNPGKNEWHQGYADNQGVYYNFVGAKDGDRYMFKTEPVMKDGNEIIQRMVFYDITKDALMWDWESTKDGGKNWNLNWRISYKRME